MRKLLVGAAVILFVQVSEAQVTITELHFALENCAIHLPPIAKRPDAQTAKCEAIKKEYDRMANENQSKHDAKEQAIGNVFDRLGGNK